MDFRWPPPPEGHPDRGRGPAACRPQAGRPALVEQPTTLVATPDRAELEYLRTGRGEPVTIFANGFGCSIADTRPLGSAVAGTRVFFHMRGHGRSWAPSGRWGYQHLGGDFRAVADFVGARRAVGTSLGAGALCHLLAQAPTRFEKLVFFLPTSLDKPASLEAQTHLMDLLDAVGSSETARAAEIIAREVPVTMRQSQAVWDYLRQRLNFLMRNGLSGDLCGLIGQAPLAEVAMLRTVTAPALIIGCRGDEIHPVSVAERLGEALPRSVLHVYDEPGVFWTHRSDLRERVSAFLNADG